MSYAPKITVFFDGSCPLCRREIKFYKTCSGESEINWVDASIANQEQLGPGLSRSQAMSRLYVRDKMNHLVSGSAAFVEIWDKLKIFRPLSIIFRPSLMQSLLEGSYWLFLKIRPTLHRLALSRECDQTDRER